MQLYIKRIIFYAVVGNVDIHTLYACDSSLKYHVSHFKTLLVFVSMRKALKNTDLSKTCMCVSLTEFEVCTWVRFSVQIYGPMQGRSKCACHKSKGKTSFCNLQEGPGKRGFSTIFIISLGSNIEERFQFMQTFEFSGPCSEKRPA